MVLRGESRKYAKNSNFESALYLTSGSMSLKVVPRHEPPLPHPSYATGNVTRPEIYYYISNNILQFHKTCRLFLDIPAILDQGKGFGEIQDRLKNKYNLNKILMLLKNFMYNFSIQHGIFLLLFKLLKIHVYKPQNTRTVGLCKPFLKGPIIHPSKTTHLEIKYLLIFKFNLDSASQWLILWIKGV